MICWNPTGLGDPISDARRSKLDADAPELVMHSPTCKMVLCVSFAEAVADTSSVLPEG